MSIDINVHLRNQGGRSTRAKSKLSAKSTHKRKKGSTSAKKSDVNAMGALSTFMSTGNILKSGLMAVPVMRAVMSTLKLADKGVNFGTAVYQAHSGERMTTSNIKAGYKIARSLGRSYIEGAIENWLYREPQVRRQNHMLDYGRKLYLRNVENEKNQFS